MAGQPREVWLGQPRRARTNGTPRSFALCYPNTYWVGMSSLGFQIIYEACSKHPEWICERFFMPPRGSRAEGRLVSVESAAPLNRFDAIGFSVSFEGDYVNVVKMLSRAGVPLLRSERSCDDPIVLAGGAAVTMNPVPLSDFFDAFVIGDGDETIHEILRYLSAPGSRSGPDRVEALSGIKGVWVPGLSEWSPSIRRVVRDLRELGESVSSCILTDGTEFPNMVMVEITRGCKRACAFCLACRITSPLRLNTAESVTNSVMARVLAAEREGISHKSISAGLVGPTVSDHPRVASICRELVASGLRVSTSSLSLETAGPELLAALRAGGQRSVTLAPEAGTERLRREIGKPASDEDVLRSLGIAREAGFGSLKLYFMLGLPTETDRDIDAIAALCREAQERHRFTRLGVSAAPFVPKPHTPFASEAMLPERELRARLQRLERGLGLIEGVSARFGSVKTARIEHALAHSGPEAGVALLRAALHSEPIGRSLSAVGARRPLRGI